PSITHVVASAAVARATTGKPSRMIAAKLSASMPSRNDGVENVSASSQRPSVMASSCRITTRRSPSRSRLVQRAGSPSSVVLRWEGSSEGGAASVAVGAGTAERPGPGVGGVHAADPSVSTQAAASIGPVRAWISLMSVLGCRSAMPGTGRACDVRRGHAAGRVPPARAQLSLTRFAAWFQLIERTKVCHASVS
ncbi:MAG: hypothetical protein ACJA2H_001330, partial [Nitriliruptoraceae bacterium]